MNNKFFQNSGGLEDGMTAIAMGAKLRPSTAATTMMESLKADAPSNKPGELSLEQAHVMILEAVSAQAASDDLTDAAEAVFDWAASDDNSYENLDGYAQSLAGIDEDADEPTDDELDAYYDALGAMADFMVTAGADSDAVQAMFDDGDDEMSATIAEELNGIDQEDKDELIATYSLSGDDTMTEALKKVVRQGKIKLIRKKFRKRRRTAAQKMALRKAQRKNHTAKAKLRRAKSMRLRAKRIN